MNRIANSNVPFEAFEGKLTKDDDRQLWQTVLATMSDEFLQRYSGAAKNRDWVMVVGACSHWVRPHNSRWNSAGGFMYPDGYNDSSPELDWSVILLFQNERWTLVEKLPGKRLTTLRVAIPTRTTRHEQAAVNATWTPGKETIVYGFRKIEDKWKCLAASNEKSRGRISNASEETM